MVNRRGAHELMGISVTLQYIIERCIKAADPRTDEFIGVKSDKGVFLKLKTWLPAIELISQTHPFFSGVYREWSEWVTYLDRTYPKNVLFRSKLLDYNDAERLMKDADKWRDAFFTFYSEPGTSYIKGPFYEVFPDSLIQGFSERTISDLIDAYSCIMHHLPTPSAMMSFRVGEQVVRLIYNKVIGSESRRKTWGEIIHTLKENEKIPKSLAGYLDYLREQRNAAGHPDKRFSLEESERILLQIKGLIEEYEKMT